MVRSETDVKYLVDTLKQKFKNATKYSYPDSGEMMELGSCISKIESALLEIPELRGRIKELETENARLVIEKATNTTA